MRSSPKVSIITPSYNMLAYLKRCRRSVADQQEWGVGLEHIIVDGGSRDGTVEWLRRHHDTGPIISEPDKGMYDAINKGLRIASGEIIGYLNCDEQYLEGTLRSVVDYFRQHPATEMVFGDYFLVRPDGTLIAFRKAFRPIWFLILGTHLYTFSCTMFFRRSLIERGFMFKDTLRDVADEEFVVRVLRAGVKASHVRSYFSAFTMTGKNRTCGANARREKRLLLAEGPRWVRMARPLLEAARIFYRLKAGDYWESVPIEYALYVDDEVVRRRFVFERASFAWRTQ